MVDWFCFSFLFQQFFVRREDLHTKNYPNKIKAIYLRSVLHSKKMERIKLLIENYNDTEFFIVDSSKEAIEHAKKPQFIA